MERRKFFISYSRKGDDGVGLATALRDALRGAGHDVFVDIEIRVGEDWRQKIDAALGDCDHLVVLLTELALQSEFVIEEVRRVVRDSAHKKHPALLPVRVQFEGDLGYQLSAYLAGRQAITWQGPADTASVAAAICASVQAGALPSGPRSTTPMAPASADGARPPADDTRRPGGLVAQIPTVQASDFQPDMSRIDRYAPDQLIGREAETQRLEDAWQQAVRGDARRPRVLTFVALGGEGKTSLVAKWAADLAHRGWSGCEAAYAWSFYSQGTREQLAASSDLFLHDALVAFGDPELANSAQSALDKGKRLAQLVGARRALLVLDGLEPLQYSPTSPTPGELKDHGITALLKGLAANSQGLCVVTTRYSIPDLRSYWQTTAQEVPLLRLSTEAGATLLRSFGVKGTPRECEQLVEDVKGHALTLNLLGAWLRDAHAGDIRKRDLVKLEEADAEEQGGHAFRVMDAYVRWLQGEQEGEKGRRALAVLRLLGLFDRPVTADCFAALLQAPGIDGLTEDLVGISEAQRNLTLARLAIAKLLAVHRDAAGGLVSLDAHPLLREYFGKRMREQQPAAWREGHRRLYEHLCAHTKEGEAPSLEELQPLYQAVAHGCQAGLLQEALDKVYVERLRQRDGCYSAKMLGAFGSDLGAVACFFVSPWSRVSMAISESYRPWLLNDAAFSLRALGRLTEALEPMRAGLQLRVQQTLWKNAAIVAGNLSELELTLGDVPAAVTDADQSVAYADCSGDAFQRIVTRTVHADALHHAGNRATPERLFREAEAMQAELQREYPLIYSSRGFRYCDLLLADSERNAWQRTMRSLVSAPSRLVDACRAVSKRAAQTLRVVTSIGWLLDIALDHLTRGRAALYEAILQGSPLGGCNEPLQCAVDGLRRAGTQHHIPRGLLTRAWLRTLNGVRTGPASAQADLDEAFEIAERGPMPLHLADIHLYRARLFAFAADGTRATTYPWQSAAHDLAEARRLIEKHGYLRRLPELDDAEAVIVKGSRP